MYRAALLPALWGHSNKPKTKVKIKKKEIKKTPKHKQQLNTGHLILVEKSRSRDLQVSRDPE